MTYTQWLQWVLDEAMSMQTYAERCPGWQRHFDAIAKLCQEHDEYRVRYVECNPDAFE